VTSTAISGLVIIQVKVKKIVSRPMLLVHDPARYVADGGERISFCELAVSFAMFQRDHISTSL
jgi:hypothetical protein